MALAGLPDASTASALTVCAPSDRPVVARLQVIQPALHRPAMRSDKPRTLAGIDRNRAPAHHRRQTNDELLNGARVPPGTRGMPEPEQVALHRVHPRLQPIVTRRRTPARPPC